MRLAYGDNIWDGGTKIIGVFGGGLRFYFADWLGVRIDVRDVVYSDKLGPVSRPNTGQLNSTSTDIRNNFFLFVGTSFLL